jgi:hypothetical protein
MMERKNINNFELITPLLNFEDGNFYHLQIIKRKKEHKELGSNSYIVKTYYIQSLEYLSGKMPEIITLCDFHNARACINLNRRNFEKLAYHLMRKVCDQIMNKDFKSTRKAYESICGAYSDEDCKKWIIDIDEQDLKKVQMISNDIKNIEPNKRENKTLAILPTKHGYHLITTVFRLDHFKELHPTIDVHKDNPTILYCPL